MTERAPAAADRFADAMTAAVLLAVDPAGLGGIVLRGGTGEIRDLLLARLRMELPASAPQRRLPPSIDPARLDGGLDVAATLATGRPVREQGLLDAAAGGLLVIPMADRLDAGCAARVARALDGDDRAAIFALDDGDAARTEIAPALADRLAFRIDLDGLTHRDVAVDDLTEAVCAAKALRSVRLGDDTIEVLADAAAAFGVPGMRPLVHAVAAARASAALAGREAVAEEDLILAARLVLVPRATCLPSPPETAAEPPPPPPEDPSTSEDASPPGDAPLADRVVEAARSALPATLLAMLDGRMRGRARGEDGRRGPEASGRGAGRPMASRPGRPSGSARLDILETLRAAAPFQRLRAAPPAGCLVALRASDLRIRRRRRPIRTTSIFVVDASGSSAIRRLAEAKGAVETVLADAYVRRDRVAMIAFRGKGAEVLLPPTASLTMARRRLVDLPAGGGTPLSAGIAAAADLAARVAAAGQRPALILLTDGEANVGADGKGGRAKAEADAIAASARIRAAGFATVLIDISDRPNPRAGRIAEALGAVYLPLPHADATGLAAAVRAVGGTRR